MNGKRYSEQQIIRILQGIDGGQTVAETYPQYSISEATVYRWKRQYRGMDESELRRLKEYNRFRPHSSLNYLPPDEFVRQHEPIPLQCDVAH